MFRCTATCMWYQSDVMYFAIWNSPIFELFYLYDETEAKGIVDILKQVNEQDIK